MSRILLAKPPFARLLGSRTYCTYALGPMMVAAMLQERGHEVAIFHDDVSNETPLPNGPVVLGEMNVAPLTDEICAPFVAVLDKFKPDVVGISYTTADSAAAHQYAKMAKHRGIRVVGGGMHVSLSNAQEQGVPISMGLLHLFDALVMGEGDCEQAAEAFESTALGFAIRTRQDDLDRYLPARTSVIGHEKYPDFLRGHIFTQRGCPYACAYCAAPAVFGTKVRTRDPAKVRAEVDALGVKHGRIIDDSFGVDRKHGLAVCAALAGSGFQWICDTALQQVDEEFAEALAAGGCEAVCMGVESATAGIQKLSGKRVTLDEAKAALLLLKRKGIGRVVFYLMLGFPGERVSQMRDTLQWARTLRGLGAEPCISLVTPYPGTRLFEMIPEPQRPAWNAGLLHQSGKARFGDVTESEWRCVIEEAKKI
jgi:anaerobic magnesium-protoporphyrin IX monomethyl ester cyclase